MNKNGVKYFTGYQFFFLPPNWVLLRRLRLRIYVMQHLI